MLMKEIYSALNNAELEVTWDTDCQVESGIYQTRSQKTGVGQRGIFGSYR